MNRTDDEIQRDLSRSLLLDEGKKSDDASEEQDESSSRSNTSFSNWWGNNKNNNGRINESNGLEMLKESDISRRKKRFDTLLRNEVAHETSATKNYILQNKKVYLSRICFALASYSIASISSLPVADQAKLSREKKITLYFSGTIFGAIIAGLWYDQKGWYSSLVLSCSSLGLSAVITAVNILLLNLPPLAMISLALSAFGKHNFYFPKIYIRYILSNLLFFHILCFTGVGAMYPISALLSTSLSSIKFNDKQMALTNFSQFTGKAVAVVSSVFVLSVIARSDDYFTPNQAKLHNGILSIFSLFAVIYVLYVGSTIRKKFSVLYDLTDDNMGGMVVHASTLFRAIVLKKKSFAGAALAWFLFDFIYYGAGEYGYLNLIVEGSDTSIHVRDAMQSVKLLIYLPGYALALLIFSYHYYFDRKNLQVVGFILLAISYCIQWPLSSSIGNACEKYFVKSQYVETGHMKTNITSQSCFDKFHGRPVRYGSDPTDIYTQCRCGEWGLFYYLKVILVIFQYTILNSTVNATTFIISADSSPRYAPATFFGLAAAAGKIGAVFGLTIFELVNYIFVLPSKKDGQALNRQSKYPILIFASLLGAVLTVLFVPRRQKKFSNYKYSYNLEDDYKSTKVRTRRLSNIDIISKISTSDFHIPSNDIDVGKPIGAGGSGTVFAGKFADQNVCLKLLAASVMSDSDVGGLKEFEHECSIMLRVSHPNIVRLFGYTARPTIGLPSQTSLYMISELCAGGSIYDILQKNEATSAQLYRWSIQVCKAMNYLHKREFPIVHLDLKPQNILLNSTHLEKALIKICDLGESKILGKDLHFRAEEIGTPGYMPPELLQTSVVNQVDLIDGAKVDIYEAGICFGYMWSGVEPFDDFFQNRNFNFSTQDILNERIMQGARPNLDGGYRKVPRYLVNLRNKMVAQIPSDRPSFEKIGQILKQFVERTGRRK